jgi:hypothetical protein
VPNYIGKIAEPEKVAQLVLKVANSKKPKTVYNINHNPLLSLMPYIPNWLLKKFIMRSLTR